MDLTFTMKLNRSRRLKELYHNKNVIRISNTHYNYPHLTFQINNLVDYIRLVKLMNNIHSTDETLVFRGMSNCEWPAVPSLDRYAGDDETIEHDMVNEFLTLRPEAFQGLQSNFEILAKMQHYGLPTRLLDFTLNPLVALYFACSGNTKNDARILCSSTYLTDNQSKIIESICSSHRHGNLVNLRIEDIVANSNLTPYEYIKRLYLQKDSRPLFVKPWYWNQRIINQSAVFLVFPNTLFDHLGKEAYYQEYAEVNQEEQLQIEEIAKSEALDQIYPIWHPRTDFEKRLESKIKEWAEQQSGENIPIQRDFSVTPKTMQKLFACHQKSEIIDYTNHGIYGYTSYGQTLLTRRFLLNQDLEVIDEDSMKEMFCSIIIGKKFKKEILSDLESIGIDNAFIYPELEYTADKIKKKYF